MNAVTPIVPVCSKMSFLLGHYDAVIFDLDGVVTQTARVHAAAWKSMFDDFLQQYAVETGTPFAPFDAVEDYRRYVDGKPRYDGVKDFLSARGIALPYGSPQDPPGMQSTCALGNRKNQLFLELIGQQGVSTYDSTLRLLRHLRDGGMKTAVVSSSRNCAAILQAAGIEALFDARVDGTDIGPGALAGKPEPDIFIEAARRIGVAPERAVIFEDAQVGVEAGRRGHFGCVIGVARNGQAAALLELGADTVVADLGELDYAEEETDILAIPVSALQHLDSIFPAPGKRLALFLDYDGTLTPIVSSPALAQLSAAMRSTLERLSHHCTVAVISGRDLADVRARVGIDALFYAGSHGFDIAGPGKQQVKFERGTEYLSLLEQAEQELRDKLAAVEGCLVERKRFSIAVHYRLVEPAYVQQIKETVAEVLREHTPLRLSKGKKVYELQPNIDWNKGKALHWLQTALDLNHPDVIPLYIGDDLTDEDAFTAIREEGIGILVAQIARKSHARYLLKDPDEVQRFLELLLTSME